MFISGDQAFWQKAFEKFSNLLGNIDVSVALDFEDIHTVSPEVLSRITKLVSLHRTAMIDLSNLIAEGSSIIRPS